jgi:hypothetical protein
MQDAMRCFSIFMPHAARETANAINSESFDFAHYTSADTLMRILDGGSENNPPKIWMRNARAMNDVEEVRHGYRRIEASLNRDDRNKRLVEALESVNQEAAQQAFYIFRSHFENHLDQTYITCMTTHDELENKIGRLSMWREYGKGSVGVAVVLNKAPFLTPSDALGAYTSPVAYHTDHELDADIETVIQNVNENREWLQSIDPDLVKENIFGMLSFGVTCLKHPGFREEREWRIIFNPKMRDKGAIPKIRQTVNGAPQNIYTLQMKDILTENDSLTGITPDALIKRVIIGPAQSQVMVREAIAEALTHAGVTNAHERVFLSDIPLRVTV